MNKLSEKKNVQIQEYKDEAKKLYLSKQDVEGIDAQNTDA